ncbi:hypothetical protein [Pleurocapsa sp. PCC 7319]|uniref:hypothetical protein n=1 Tax=Pleurocapsa sp. PCC 7319 TaxID=118161 RepID=UPI00034D463E|nr:hypothetical protein [Pleurocapsa sp. PCC 7319]
MVLRRRSSETDFITTIDTVATSDRFELSSQEFSDKIATEQFSFIENCNYLLAAEIINFWLINHQHNLDFKNTLKILGITIQLNNNLDDFSIVNKLEFDCINTLIQSNTEKLDLFEILETRFKYLFKNLPVSLDSLKYLEENTIQWYKGNKLLDRQNTCTFILKRNSIILRDELKKRYQSLIGSFWHHTSLTSILEHLKMLELFLFKSIGQFSEKRKECILKERGCLKVYNKCVLAMNSGENLDWNYNISIKALSNLYTFKLKAEIYCRAGQALKDIMRLNQLCIYDLNNTCSFLTQIRDDFCTVSNRDIHSLSPLLLEQMLNRINIAKLRHEMEQELGHSLHKWGASGSITTNKIENTFLRKLEPFTQKFCSQIFIQLAQEFGRNDLKGTLL